MMQSFWKVTRAEREKSERKEERAEAKARELCRYKTFRRAHGCCQRCGRPLVLKPSAAKHEFEIANIHEEPPRSQGGDPLDDSITVCLCVFCHKLITDNRIMILWIVPGKKAYGGVKFAPYVKGVTAYGIAESVR